MKSLTLWPEWSFAVCHLGKRVENRPRPAAFYGLRPGDVFAIAAGQSMGGRPGVSAAVEAVHAVAGMARLAMVRDLTSLAHPPDPTLQISSGARCSMTDHQAQSVVAVARLESCSLNTRADGGWAVPGQYGLRLTDVRVLVPVGCSVGDYPGNRQGGWTLPGEVARAVVAQLWPMRLIADGLVHAARPHTADYDLTACGQPWSTLYPGAPENEAPAGTTPTCEACAAKLARWSS